MTATTTSVVFPLARLQPNRGAAVLLPGEIQVAVFRTHDDQVFALSNIDPFARAAVMSRGIVGDRGGVPVAVSPMHKNAFDLRTGVCVDDPDVSLEVYPVRVDAGMVMVGAP
ncbi:nitrite reductase small subunit NirD [Kibdelosporangium persicum]|uniref:Nitrite reductase small subunit NirD n=1 Tax=Kibdelosporangium persicum TaxID=2698649 RepID=A0ABX2FDY7_9PSEU|nr:nitrite reductase small subunit NirD [Kibdelosporangium persicum]NRN69095.1 Nitrite reductase small subunit NirD [Kibdelosporangium persicum]